MTRLPFIAALVLLFFNALSALFGGWQLMKDPSGSSMEMPTEWLFHSPFTDFLIPGIILFTVNGILSLVIGILTIFKIKGYAYLIILQGAILAGWLTIQIIIIRMFYLPLHGLYYLVAIFLIASGWFILKNKSKNKQLK